MSIGHAQAQALADGFLDSFGSGKEGLQPRETFTEIILLAGELIESCQDNLNTTNTNASGKLSASLVANEPEVRGTAMKIDVMMNFYGNFVNKGVKGTKDGTSTAGYSFKYDLPSRKMVAAIKEWQSKAQASTKNTNAKKTISRNEIKNTAISDLSKTYAIARSICQHGIKPTGFLDKAVDKTTTKVADRLGSALRIDVLNALQ
jgi:hypothetical protein